MQYQSITGTALEVSRIVLGCMTLPPEPPAAVATIRAALDLGITCFDHADVYGRGVSEAVFASLWAEMPHLRAQIVLQSKCGIRPAGDPDERAAKRYDFSRDHILSAVDGSLRRLKTDYLDILLLHRPDALVEPEQVAEAFDRLHQGGKVRHFGVSNHTGAQIELLKAYLAQSLIVNQLQLSLLHSQLINAGIIANQERPAVAGEGTLEYCRRHAITLQAWSPLARGALTGPPPADADQRTRATATLVAELAQAKGVSPEAIAIAWLLRHPARMQVVIGTTNAARMRGCVEGLEVTLTREEWYALFTTGRGYAIP
jgi:predicted oxidoreductase